MLVLVLILVVIALVLLLAGWFLHLVVLAWTSVGISVLAGLVLLYDWWQTRSAVRAGRQGSGGLRDGDGDRDRAVPQGAAAAGAVGAGAAGAGAAGAMGAGPDGYGGADMEPATQVLPVVPPPSNSAEETVVMPVVAPSGSPEAPSGASRSSGLSSQSVTESPADEPAATRSTDGGTTAVDPAAGPEPGGRRRPGGRCRPARRVPVRTGARGRVRRRWGGADPRHDRGDGGAGGRAPAGAPRRSRRPTGPARPVPRSPAERPRGRCRRRAVRPPRQRPGRHPGARTTARPAPTGRPVPPRSRRRWPRRAGRAPGRRPHADRGAVDTSGEAPEEPRDQAHASLVARLPDEVIVIDEHPRYHVQGCPSLPGQPLIPLPVSEAVELGFTPCGWCTPNRVLSERNPAEAR